MKDIEKILESTPPDLLDPNYVVAVARHKGVIHWVLSHHDNLVLDWKKWRDDFVAAGHQVPDMDTMLVERSGIETVDQNNAEEFLSAPVTYGLSFQCLRDALLERFPDAQSWWDVDFLFPIASIDFDRKRLAGFYQIGPRLERYVPDGWVGEFADFANIYAEDMFPAVDKFWIVDGRDLLFELNERGRAIDPIGTKADG